MGNNSDVYTASLDYSVCHQSYDSYEFEKEREHRGGVECLTAWCGNVLSGGRDGYVRGNEGEFYRVGKVVQGVEGLDKSGNLAVKSNDELIEIDYYEKRCRIKTSKLPKNYTLMKY